MQSLSRRDAIKGGTALAATATLGFPAMADNPDAELLALEGELVRAIDAFNAAGNISDEEFNRRGAYTSALESRIAEMPAKTADGVAVKLRRLRYIINDDDGMWTNELMETSIAALERLAGGVS